MKKILSFLLFALCLTVAANAQSSCETPTNVTVTPGATSATVSWTGSSEQYNVLYSSNFYCSADDIDGWAIYDVDGDGYSWYLANNGRSGADDDIAFVSDSYYYGALDPDNWLITPIINLGGTMSVWMKSYSPSYLDTFAIYLTTDLNFNEVEDFNIPLVVKSVAPDEWTEYTADLSAYAGQQGYIAIRHFNSYDQYALLMDDFRVDGEGIMLSNVSSPVELPGLIPEAQYQVQVQAICTSGVSEWSDPVEFTTHGLCDVPSSLSVTPSATTASLEWTGYQDQYTVRYQTLESYNSYLASGMATVTLTIGDVWGDGSGYQMLLDADATAYGDIIPETGGLTNSGDASEAVYAEFEYKIPANADGLLNTSNIVLNNSVTISIPAGIYDFCITNPTPGDRMWIASNNGTVNGREDDYVFEAGKTYEFEVTPHGSNDGVDVTITSNIPEDSWTKVTNVSNPAEISGLNPETTYVVQVQGICEDGVTAWSEPVEFTTEEETEEPCVINTIEITGFTEPVYGATPDYDVEVPADANYTLGNVNWMAYNYSMFTTIFMANTYYMTIYITPNEGCSFSEDVTMTINGRTDLVDVDYGWVTENGDYEFFSIDYTLSAPSTCETPTNLTATNITATSAKLGWTGNLEQYTVRYKDDAASDWTTATTANSTLALTGLTPATTYTAQVQGDCGSGAKSVTDWSEPVTFTTLSGTIEPGECGPAVDCEGTSYPTVKIGDVCWMAKNLTAETCVTTGNVYSYVNDQFPDEDANVETYGLLYDEEAAFATGICPEGYTLPTTEQFEYLKNNFTVEELRNSTGWVVNTGTNGTGFSWDGSGFRNGTSETFDHMLMEGYLWAVDMTSGTPQPAMYKMMYYCNEIVRVYDFNGISASIRCVKIAEPQPEPEPEPEPETFTCGTDNLIIGENSYETVQIGTQCWTKTNMREPVGEEIVSGNTEYPATEAYRFKVPSRDLAIYGYLYNWKAANMVCPTGWHLPTDAEWTQMENVVSTIPIDPDATGERGDHLGKLAAYDENWDPSSTPNTPGYTEPFDDRNVSGFSARPMGYYWRGFDAQTRYAQFWTATENPEDNTKAYDRWMGYLYTSVQRYSHSKTIGYSVRCLRDAEPGGEEPGGEEPTSFNCGTDPLIIGENSYETVQIGTQCWTKTNMRETKDKNGNDFINGISAAAGSFDEYEDAVIYIPTAEKWNENNSSVTYNNNTFGYYYNWTAANNVCPVGWHLPSDEEWTQLETYVSNAQESTVYVYRCDQSDATSIAKALASKTDWRNVNGECYPGDQSVKPNNATGFSAVPAGNCFGSSFTNAGYNAIFWSATQYASNPYYAYYRSLYYSGAYVTRYTNGKYYGYSVRCLRDSE